MRWHSVCLFALALLAGLNSFAAALETNSLPVKPEDALAWREDYSTAIRHATAQHEMLLVWFFDPAKPDDNDKFAAAVLDSAEVRPLLAKMTLLKVSTAATIEENDKQVPIVKARPFIEMRGLPGIALVDLRDAKQKFHARVVSVYPFLRGPITTAKLKILCDLPPGTLTQRTLIFAVRTHRAAPQSAWSPHSPFLAAEAEKHSQHQASLNLQGHHNWDARFHQINAGLGIGGAREVCAESWSGQTLLDAAEECVDSWSQSAGHWSSVSARHAYFGYDMKRGTNGVWYATGIFAGR